MTMTFEQKYNLYYSILEKYNLESFDEYINNNAFLCCVNCEFYNDFENIEKTVFECVSELNKHISEFDDFFVFYRTCVDDEYNDTIIITSVSKLYDDLKDDNYL